MFKEWLEKFATTNNIELAKIYDGLTLFDKEIANAKSEAKTELEKVKQINANLERAISTLKLEFNLKGDDLNAEIKELITAKSANTDEAFKGLNAEISQLKAEIAKEKADKSEAVRKNRLNKIIETLKDINPDHKEIIEIKLNKAFKIDDSGKEYFENEKGEAVEAKSFLDDFFKANERYIKPKGTAGNGVNGTFKPSDNSQKKFSEMSLTEKAFLYKTNPSEYEKLKEQGD